MRKALLLAILLAAGCRNITGPLEYRQPTRVDDPLLPIYEQQKLGRDQLALPEDEFDTAPAVGMVPDGVFSR